ncbi:retrovirus-related pol polyprotein from transposon TNT 1-94 [Tanacetum coccineum]
MHSSKKKELRIKLLFLEHLNRMAFSKDKTALSLRLLAQCSQLLNFLSDTIAPSQQELDLLFGPLYDEFFTAGTSSVNKSSSPTEISKQKDTPPTKNIQSLTKPTTPTTNVNAEENNDNQAADTQIEAMREELYQFDRLQVWELVDKPFGKTVIKLKWLWKNKKDEDQTVIRNKARIVAKGYAHE